MSTPSLAELTGRGSFTFKLGTERFRGAAVPLADYFSYAALEAVPGMPEYTAWMTPLLAERHLPTGIPTLIDGEWVEAHMRLAHREALESILLEEVPPGEALDTEKKQFALGKLKFWLHSYTLREYADWVKLTQAYAVKDIPMDMRLEEVARALRVRHVSGLSDPALLDTDWVIKTLDMHAFKSIETLLIHGTLLPPAPPESAPNPKS